MKRSRSGFSLFFVIMLVLVVAVIAAAGFAVANRQAISNFNKNYPLSHGDVPVPVTKTYTDTAKQFSFKYPAAWKISYPNTNPLEGPAMPEQDWTKHSRLLTVVPDGGQKDNPIYVTPGCTTPDQHNNQIDIIQALRNTKDKFHSQQNEKVNGFTVLYDKLAYTTDAEKYLDHTYAVEKDSVCLTIRWQQYYHNRTTNTDFDDSRNLSGFQMIAHSVKAL